MPKVLLIEDDPAIHNTLSDWLNANGYTVELAEDGQDGLSKLKVYQYDLAIVDWELPGLSGVEVCRQFRSAKGKTPIIMLTGKSAVDEKITGLDSGADDYLTKPFHPRELDARIRSVLRRPETVISVMKVRNLVLDSITRSVTRDGEPLKLSRREYSLLEFLMRHPGHVFTHESLLNRVWSSESDATEQALRQSIRRLRVAIDEKGAESVIVSVPGVGYKLQE